jgi:ABC-2 type transport system permease protein
MTKATIPYATPGQQYGGMAAGLINHLLLTLRLNLRNLMAMVYGYLVPVFTLVAFASIFKYEEGERLVPQMGQLLTICVLGGACYGLPTAIVSDRERGVWRRYRLLPAALGSIVFSTIVARYLIVGSAALLELALAHYCYHMPWPPHPWQLVTAFTFSCFAFLGMGLVIAMVAESVPAVQALGNAIFLPMIMIGGVGVPLHRLPPVIQGVAHFLPGLYSVDAIQACINPATLIMGPDGKVPHGLPDVGFDLAALTVIGAAALLAGAKLFRWDNNRKLPRGSYAWVTAALAAWIGVGLMAVKWPAHATVAETHPKPMIAPPATTEPTTRVVVAPTSEPASKPATCWRSITDADVNGIGYDDLEPDTSDVTPLAQNLDNANSDDDRKKKLDDFTDKISDWASGKVEDPVQRARSLLSVAAAADVAQDQNEAEIPFIIFQILKGDMPREQLIKVLTCIILHPDEGTVVTTAPELDLPNGGPEDEIRARTAAYGKKLLARLVGKVLESK